MFSPSILTQGKGTQTKGSCQEGSHLDESLTSDERTSEGIAVVIDGAEGLGIPGPFSISAPAFGQTLGAKGAKPPGYLEQVDNVRFEPKTANISNWLSATCDRGKGYFIVAECEDGHRFAKELVCNKDWCRVCGEDGSIAHNRRFARWLPKIFQVESMGYFTYTLPEGVRDRYRTQKALAKLGHAVQELLKSYGFSRGLRRWHWFGDKSTKYHPHLNVMVDVPSPIKVPCKKKPVALCPVILRLIKADYARLLGVDLADVNFHYRTSPGKKVHTLKYITRATFLSYEWDKEMAEELRGFRNMVVWGRGLWDGQAVWSLSDLKGKAKTEVEGLDLKAIADLVEKKCPVCGKPVVWGEALPIGLLKVSDKEDLGAGYWWLLPDIPVPRGLPDDRAKRKARDRRFEVLEAWIRRSWYRPFNVGVAGILRPGVGDAGAV